MERSPLRCGLFFRPSLALAQTGLAGIGRSGYLALDFLRKADSAAAALSRAITDVARAIPSAELVDIRSDFKPTEIFTIISILFEISNRLR